MGTATNQKQIWRNADGSWSHGYDAKRRWSDKAACETDYRFHREWRGL